MFPLRPPFGRRTRALIGLVAVVGLVAACTSSRSGSGQPGATPSSPAPSTASSSVAPGASPAPTIGAATFNDCSSLFDLSAIGIPPSRRSKLVFSCGRIMVPLDYSKPDGEKVPIQLIKVHYTAEKNPIGSLLVNPGGPGGSGVLLALGLAGTIEDAVLDRYDLVGFDPRGVSLSGAVKCFSSQQTDTLLAADYDVRTAAGLSSALKLSDAETEACTSKYGSSLTAYNTVNTARDMDLIRQSVGDKSMHYLGFSYGTELGGVYAHLFPSEVATMVLDGAVDPATEHDPIESTEIQTKGFEEAFGQYAGKCSTRSTCSTKIGNPEAAVLSLEKTADATPISTSVAGDTRTANSGIVLLAVLSALYSESDWPKLDTALVEARQGDAKGLFALTDSYAERDSSGTYSNLLDMLQVVSCNDTASGPTNAQIQAAAVKWATEYPLFGLVNAQSLTSCRTWPTPRTPPPNPTAASAKPILVLGNLNDPATPYVGSQNLTKTLGGAARLLTWNGQGHTSYGESSCIDTLVNAYLTAGTLPAVGTVCQ